MSKKYMAFMAKKKSYYDLRAEYLRQVSEENKNKIAAKVLNGPFEGYSSGVATINSVAVTSYPQSMYAGGHIGTTSSSGVIYWNDGNALLHSDTIPLSFGGVVLTHQGGQDQYVTVGVAGPLQRLFPGDLISCENDHPICVVMSEFEIDSYGAWLGAVGFWKQEPFIAGTRVEFARCERCAAPYMRYAANGTLEFHLTKS